MSQSDGVLLLAGGCAVRLEQQYERQETRESMSNTFFGKSYLYNGKIIGVVQGLGEQYIIAYYGDNGGRHRVRNYKAFGIYDKPEDAQKALDAYSKEYYLKAVD